MYIRSKGRGKWQCVWEVRDPVTGQRRRVTEIRTGTKRDAEAHWTRQQVALQDAAARPAPVHPRTWTVADLVTRWIADGAAIDASTRARYQSLLTYHIAPVLGPLLLTTLHPATIQAAEHRWLTAGRADGTGGLAASTVRQIHAILQGALRQAVDWDLIPANPMARVRRPRLDPPRQHVWTPAEVDAYWAAVAQHTRPPRPPGLAIWTPADITRFWTVARTHRQGRILMLVLRTGLRQGEVLGLRWADVDDAGPALRVTQQLLEPRATLPFPTFANLKTDAGRRTVELDAETMALLRQERTAQKADRLAAGPAYQDHGLVFQTGVGTPIRPRNTNRLLLQLQRAAHVAPIRFHDLRHTHASLLIAGGADARLVADRLGHQNVAFTLQIYGHLWPGRQREVLTALPALGADGPLSG